MVSINGSTSPLLPNGGKSSKVSANSAKSESRAVAAVPSSPNAVASAVALSVKAQKNADFQQSQIQYDLPEGKARKALDEYFSVMSQAQRDEISQMLGVDMYV